MSWKKVKIGEILIQKKESIIINDSIEYKQITVSNSGKIKLRGLKKGFEIGTKKQYIAKQGMFIYSRLGVHEGSFGIIPKELDGAIVTGDMPIFNFNKDKILKDFFLFSIKDKSFMFKLLQLTRGLAQVRIRENVFLNLEINLPNIEYQNEIVNKILSVEKEVNQVNDLNQTNIELVKQLRQSILQDAIQGKLVEQDPNDEPSCKLLEKIKNEKEILIKEKKIKKEIDYKPISEEEKLFDLPKGWEWVRITNIFYGIEKSKSKQIKTSKYLKIGKYPIIDQGKNYINGYCNDINKLIKIENPVIIFGDHTREIKYVDFNFVPGADGTQIMVPIFPINEKYFYYVIKNYNLGTRGYARHYKILKEKIFPLPPIKEQKRIVEKIEELMKYCDILEKQINETKENSENLMESVLGEVFMK